MKPSDKLRDAEALETYRLMLKKAETHPEINKALTGMGYNAEKLKKGKALINSTREIYDANSRKKDELSIHSTEFSRKKKEVEQTHRLHRSKARILSRNDDDMKTQLELEGTYPRGYIPWIENIKKFYNQASGDQVLQEKLMEVRLTRKEIDKGLKDIKEIQDMYAKFIRLRGESKQATVDKKEAFKKLHEWMIDFYALARLSMKKNPELLEALHSSN